MAIDRLCCCLQISNYAKPDHRSRHNQVYWKCQPYYAFGLGAASYTQGRRFSRPRGMQEYDAWVQRFVQSGGGCPAAELPPESKVRAAVHSHSRVREFCFYCLQLLALCDLLPAAAATSDGDVCKA
jgi:coproporphyrinogen III oxidase-like Fe-S oxidoreductase